MVERPKTAVVGVDLRHKDDNALRWALTQAAEEPITLHLVHVIGQRELDETGALSRDSKRSTALERCSRKLTDRAQEVANALLFEAGVDVDVRRLNLHLQPRIIEGHVIQAERLTAEALVQVAIDYNADTIVLSRRGRPDSVFDHMQNYCVVVDDTVGALLLKPLADDVLSKSKGWTADAQ